MDKRRGLRRADNWLTKAWMGKPELGNSRSLISVLDGAGGWESLAMAVAGT